MANLTETSTFDANIYRIDQTDPVQGWDGSTIGVSNEQAQKLANRTQWLKSRVDLGARYTAILPFAPISSGATKTVSAAETKGLIHRIDTSTYDAVFNLPLAASCDDGANMLVTVEPGASLRYLIGGGKHCIISISGSDTIFDPETSTSYASYMLHPFTAVRIIKIDTTKWMVLKDISAERSPAGIVSPWAVDTPPYGWLECNGAAVSRTTYARLFTNLGIAFGAGNGTTTFNIPDLRGEFIRGWDNGRGIDNDGFVLQATTTSGSANVTNADTTGLIAGMSITGAGIPVGTTIASITNSTTFVLSANATATANFVSLTVSKVRAFGSLQLDQFELHTHKISRLQNVVNSTSPTTAAIGDWEGVGNVQSTDNVQPVGGAETRPRNIALMYCIKY